MHNRVILKTNNKNYLYISLSSIDDSFKASMHLHNNLEIILITSGNGSIITSNNKIEVSKGDLIILNSNNHHYEDGIGLTYFALGVSKLNYFIKADFKRKIIKRKLSESSYKSMYMLYEYSYNEAINNKNYSADIIENLVNLILLNIKRDEQIVSNESYLLDDELVSNIKSLIDNYYSSDITLDDIAYKLSTSKSLITHKFKALTNKTIIEYKIEKQLEEAKNMLDISDMPVNVICDMVGFNSVSYFIKAFKNKYGLTPNNYKKTSKQNI